MAVGTTVKQDADGEVISVEEGPCVATISFHRKNGLPNYSNEELFVSLQIPLDDVSSLEAIEAQLDPNVAFLKSYVYRQLGVTSEIVDGVIVGEVPVETPKGVGFKRKAATSTTPPIIATTDDDKNELFSALAGATANGKNWKDQNDETIWDNRVGKRNPRSPDFKWAQSGKSLWLTDAPEWFVGPGEGIKI